MTRSLIIFGQSEIRCHQYLYKEMSAARDSDAEHSLTDFDALIWRHLGHMIGLKWRAFFHNLTGGWFASAPRAGKATRYYRQLARASASFAFVAEVALVLLGGALSNFPYPRLGWLMRFVVFPLGLRRRPPKDKLNGRIAELLLTPSATRDRLTAGIYIGPADQPIGQLDVALQTVVDADAITTRLRRLGVKANNGVAAHAISAAEKDILDQAEDLIRKVIAVDDFAPEDISPLWNSR